MRRGSAYRRASANDYGLWKRSNVREQRPPKHPLMIDVRLRETSYCCVGPKASVTLVRSWSPKTRIQVVADPQRLQDRTIVLLTASAFDSTSLLSTIPRSLQRLHSNNKWFASSSDSVKGGTSTSQMLVVEPRNSKP